MNKYKLRMRTLTGLGNEYVYVYATSNFERYLNIHNLKYARDITKDYQLTDRFEQLQQENRQLKDEISEYKRLGYKHLQEKNNKLESVLDEIRDNIQNSINSINNKLSDKEIRVENGMVVNPINDYRVVRLKAIRMKCKELLKILDKVKEC